MNCSRGSSSFDGGMECRANASRAGGGGSNLYGGATGTPTGGLEIACSGPGKLQRFSGDLRVGRADDIDDRAVSGEGKIEPMLVGTAPALDFASIGTNGGAATETVELELVFGVLELKSTPDCIKSDRL